MLAPELLAEGASSLVILCGNLESQLENRRRCCSPHSRALWNSLEGPVSQLAWQDLESLPACAH